MNRHIPMAVRRALHAAAGWLVAALLPPGAVYEPRNFRRWERRGYHITPLHFYSPIPDTRDLAKHPLGPSSLAGIDLAPDRQLRLLAEAFPPLAAEYAALPRGPSAPGQFYLDNDAYTGLDPLVYYGMIRYFRPATIVEVGSGHSTLIGALAAQRAGAGRYVCIDPWPRDFIARGVPGIEFSRRRVEAVDLDLFRGLKANDILFVDSSHVVRTAGDVAFLVLEVLPRLAPGVIIHFHDVFLPDDYPRAWLVEQHRFWNEQYLLQAYLAENSRVEVLLANHYLAQQHPDSVQRAFPGHTGLDGAAFWIRKRNEH